MTFSYVDIKTRVYSQIPKLLDNVRSNIVREKKLISKETLKEVFYNFEKKVRLSSKC